MFTFFERLVEIKIKSRLHCIDIDNNTIEFRYQEVCPKDLNFCVVNLGISRGGHTARGYWELRWTILRTKVPTSYLILLYYISVNFNGKNKIQGVLINMGIERRLESRLWFLIFNAWQRKYKNEVYLSRVLKIEKYIS